MRKRDVKAQRSSDLVAYFRDIALEQDEAEIDGAIARYNILFKIRLEIAAELRSRLGDQRRLLVALYDDLNLRVRLYAALATLAVAPTEARQVLDQIHDWGLTPYCAEAGNILEGLDDGSLVPR